jgi:drug/metabolite transporter (DMT)-like permease
MLYVGGALFLKQAGGHGVGLWRTTFVANLICGASFNVLWFLGGNFPSVALWWQPAVVALLFFAGQILSFLAIERGDVSVATPVFGVKVVIVAVFVTLVLRETVSVALWLAAILSSVGIVFLNRSGAGQSHHHTGLTIGLGMLASACYALFDVLVQKWSPAWGAGRFLPMLMWFVALYSFALIPFFHAPLRSVPRPAWRPLLCGGALIATASSLSARFTPEKPRRSTLFTARADSERAGGLVAWALVRQHRTLTCAGATLATGWHLPMAAIVWSS